jgi:hypothetical protein
VFGETSIVFTLVLGALAIVSLSDLIRNRGELFGGRFTEDKRSRILRFVLFVLLPLSVLAHEGGHALTVLAFGGEVVDFGFYLYYGYVGHIGAYTPLERGLISFSGPIVNIVLGLAAIAVAWFRPRRPQINFLLLTFGAVQLLNALIFYPLIDAMGGISGDWETIYSRDTPVFSAMIGLMHVTIVAGAVVLWKSPRFHAGYAKRTALGDAQAVRREDTNRASPHRQHEFLVHERVVRDDSGAQPPGNISVDSGLNELSGLLAVASAMATEGWRHPIRLISDAQAGGVQVVLRWESEGFARALLIHSTLDNDPQQHVEIHGAAEHPALQLPVYERPLARVDGRPTVQELAPYIRRFLDFVDAWDGATVASPN